MASCAGRHGGPGRSTTIVWRGWGIVVVGLAFAALLVTQVAVNALLGAGYYTAHGWPKFAGLAVAAAFTWVLSSVLAGRPGRVVIDAQTGEQLTLGGGDHLFFVPVRFWPHVLLVAGLVFAVMGNASPTAQASLPSPAPTSASEGAPVDGPVAALQVAKDTAAMASGLLGRWSGAPGADGVREVLVIDAQDASVFGGHSFFEDGTGMAAAGGQGTVSGTVTGDQVTFTITRDSHDFVWNGTRTDTGRTLSGQFDGFSHDATYHRE